MGWSGDFLVFWSHLLQIFQHCRAQPCSRCRTCSRMKPCHWYRNRRFWINRLWECHSSRSWNWRHERLLISGSGTTMVKVTGWWSGLEGRRKSRGGGRWNAECGLRLETRLRVVTAHLDRWSWKKEEENREGADTERILRWLKLVRLDTNHRCFLK